MPSSSTWAANRSRSVHCRTARELGDQVACALYHLQQVVVAILCIEGGRVGGVDEGPTDADPAHLSLQGVDGVGRYTAIVAAPERDVSVENGYRGSEVEVYLSHSRPACVLSEDGAAILSDREMRVSDTRLFAKTVVNCGVSVGFSFGSRRCRQRSYHGHAAHLQWGRGGYATRAANGALGAGWGTSPMAAFGPHGRRHCQRFCSKLFHRCSKQAS